MTSVNNYDLLPSIAVVTINYNGKKYLRSCFESLQQLNYPKGKIDIICVDNNSSDASVEFISRNFPDVRCIEAGTNLGFAGGCNLGARTAQSDYVAFVNNDATVDKNWLIELVNTVEEEKAVCASAKILDSKGVTIDFVGSHLNFLGFARQIAWRTEAEPSHFNHRKPILAACGGAMLINRQVFLEAGGFDEDYFMFYEDVDLGWRLWILGYKVIFAPKALTYHRHHGSAGKVDKYRKQFLYERNALATIIKNYEQVNLDRILPAALFLAASRTTDLLQTSNIAPDILHPHNWNLPDNKLRQNISVGKLAPLMAMRDITLNIPTLMEKRKTIQSKRSRSDQEIFELFGQPLRMYFAVPQLGGTYAWMYENLIDSFQIREVFQNIGKRILILSNYGLPQFDFLPTPGGLRAEVIGEGMEAKGYEVFYSMPTDIIGDRTIPNCFKKLAWSKMNLEDIIFQVGPDVVIVCDWQILEFMAAGVYRPVVLDQYGLDQKKMVDFTSFSTKQKNSLANVDLFTCSSEDQAELLRSWLKYAGITATLDNIRVVPATSSAYGQVQGIEPLHSFCQKPSVKMDKSKINSTSLFNLPLKAWHVFKTGGIKNLKAEIDKYFTWRKLMR